MTLNIAHFVGERQNYLSLHTFPRAMIILQDVETHLALEELRKSGLIRKLPYMHGTGEQQRKGNENVRGN